MKVRVKTRIWIVTGWVKLENAEYGFSEVRICYLEDYGQCEMRREVKQTGVQTTEKRSRTKWKVGERKTEINKSRRFIYFFFVNNHWNNEKENLENGKKGRSNKFEKKIMVWKTKDEQ